MYHPNPWIVARSESGIFLTAQVYRKILDYNCVRLSGTVPTDELRNMFEFVWLALFAIKNTLECWFHRDYIYGVLVIVVT